MADARRLQTALEAARVGPGLVRAGTSVEGGVRFDEAEAVREARCAILAAEGGCCAGVTDDVTIFDGLVGVVAVLGSNMST